MNSLTPHQQTRIEALFATAYPSGWYAAYCGLFASHGSDQSLDSELRVRHDITLEEWLEGNP